MAARGPGGGDGGFPTWRSYAEIQRTERKGSVALGALFESLQAKAVRVSEILMGDVRDVLPTLESESVQMCVTSPPYWGLRDYGVDGQLGLEATPEEYVANMVDVFREVRRVLKDDGTLWLNMGDSYGSGGGNTVMTGGKHDPERGKLQGFDSLPRKITNLKPKDLVGIPWRLAFALQADGWYLRQDIIWHKPNPMPESVTDRCTKAHEYLFLLSKSARYYFDADAIAEKAVDEPGKGRGGSLSRPGIDVFVAANAHRGTPPVSNGKANKRSVWTVASQPYADAHFATFPPKLIDPCILAGSRSGDVVLDPFLGSGTTGQVCERLGRDWVGIELSSKYAEMAKRRTAQMGLVI